jgi:KDO2-lipid IV(A) lauroyltransferase
VRRLRANLHRVVPAAAPDELDALVTAAMRSYARYWCEAFRLPSMDRDAVLARTDSHGTATMFEALEQGRGVVAALPHSGNWDIAGLWFVQTQARLGRSARITTVVERLRPESLFRRFVAYREGLGFEVLAAGDGPVVYRTLVQRLREGGLVCLVADRDLSSTGLEVSFFGEPAKLPSGPARLAARTGALLLPAFPSFTPDGWAVTMGDPVPVPGPGSRDDVAKATQALADALAALIATAPHDWHMLQRVWTADVRSRA